MASLQVRDLPPDVHRRLKASAAVAGQSLSDHVRELLVEVAGTPTVPELLARVSARERYVGPSTAALIREDRDRR